MPDLRDAVLDLLLGSRCVGCQRPGRPWCAGCDAGSPVVAMPSWPVPTPPGLVTPFATGEYAEGLRALVVAFKEEGVRGLEGPLSRRLAASVAALGIDGDIVLVPVPSRAASVRSRGLDTTAVLTRRAARLLRRSGVDATVWPGLRLHRVVRDQAGLGAAARADNLHGSMATSTAALRRLARRRTAARIVICDDVLTTGATAREAQRALSDVGLQVLGIAVVAATRRRFSFPGLGST